MKRLELVVGLVLVVLVVGMALLSYAWTPFDPTAVLSAPPLQAPGWPHVLGTDGMGIDILSRILVGARSAIYVGVIAVGLAAVVGVPLGLLTAQLPRPLAEGLATPLAAQLATQPLVTLLSGQISLAGLIANLAAGPLVGPATVLGFLAAAVAVPLLPVVGTSNTATCAPLRCSRSASCCLRRSTVPESRVLVRSITR